MHLIGRSVELAELTSRRDGFRVVPCLPTWHAAEGAEDARLKRRLRRLVRAGRYHLCPNLEFLATPPYDGALLQYLLMDARCYFPIPDSMSYEDGALIEPLSVGLWGCQRAGLQPGDDVLVTATTAYVCVGRSGAVALPAVLVDALAGVPGPPP